MQLNEFDFEVVFRPGKLNSVSDALYRAYCARLYEVLFKPFTPHCAILELRVCIGVREGILLGGRKKFALKVTICPKNRQLALKLTF